LKIVTRTQHQAELPGPANAECIGNNEQPIVLRDGVAADSKQSVQPAIRKKKLRDVMLIIYALAFYHSWKRYLNLTINKCMSKLPP
jgi:hypothetical protein